jgi:hypothetical protein
MENTVAYRLSFDEIIYLCASLAQPKVLFGLSGEPMPADWAEKKWGGVKKDLLDHGIIEEKDGQLVLCDDMLGLMINAVSRPKVMAAIRPGGTDLLTRLYVRGGTAVSVENEDFTKDYFQLRAHMSYTQLREMLNETVNLGNNEYKPGEARAETDTESLERLMEAAGSLDLSRFKGLAQGYGLAAPAAEDLFEALQEKNRLLSYIVYAFDPYYTDGIRRSKESVLYGGAAHMWEIGISGGTARISITGRDAVLEEFQAVSRLMDFV